MIIDSNKTYKKFLVESANKLRREGKVKDQPSLYFGQIGSIPLEDLNYEDQIFIKNQALNIIFNNKYKINITKSDIIHEYRFRMDYVCSYNPFHEPNNRFGQRKAGRFNWVVDMSEPVLFKKEWFLKARLLFELAISEGIEIYDLVKHTGDLRYIVVKAQGNESMISFVSKEGNTEKYKNILKEAEELGFSSINLVKQPKLTDLSEGDVVKSLRKEYIRVKVKDSVFDVGVNTFFQNNLKTFEKIIDYITQELKEKNSEYLIDLYAGVGTIGIIFSKQFKKVFGYEIDSENIKYSKQNIDLNKAYNYSMIQKDLNSNDLIEEVHKEQILIVDPPRIGLEQNGINNVLSFDPKKIVYISCNPVTQARDIKELENHGYKIKKINGFDMFPHTYHLESVAIIEKTI